MQWDLAANAASAQDSPGHGNSCGKGGQRAPPSLRCAMGCAAGLVHCPPRAPSAFQSPRHTQLPPSPDPQIGPPAPPPCSPARGPRLSGAAAPGSATWRGKERAGGKRGMESGGERRGAGTPPTIPRPPSPAPASMGAAAEGGREGGMEPAGRDGGRREGGRDERRSCVICLSLLCALSSISTGFADIAVEKSCRTQTRDTRPSENPVYGF